MSVFQGLTIKRCLGKIRKLTTEWKKTTWPLKRHCFHWVAFEKKTLRFKMGKDLKTLEPKNLRWENWFQRHPQFAWVMWQRLEFTLRYEGDHLYGTECYMEPPFKRCTLKGSYFITEASITVLASDRQQTFLCSIQYSSQHNRRNIRVSIWYHGVQI
jgi:hypothetical protein